MTATTHGDVLAALSGAQEVLCERHDALCLELVAKRNSGVPAWAPEVCAIKFVQERYDAACQAVYAEIERVWALEEAARQEELERLHQHQASLQDWADAHGEDYHGARREQELEEMRWADDGGPV